MRIALLGNIAGVSNQYLIGLRKIGIQTDLFLRESEYAETLADIENNDHLTVHAKWLKAMPQWGVISLRNPVARRLFAVVNVYREIPVALELLKYDVIHSHTGTLTSGLLLPLLFIVFGAKRYVAAATGSDIREVALLSRGLKGRLMRAFFRRSDLILLLNIDMLEIAEALKLRNAVFFPFAIDTQNFKPQRVQRMYASDDTFLMFMMSRLDWGKNDWFLGRTSTNENDRVFYAYQKFLEDYPNALLIVSDRGSDREEAKQLVGSLGISNRVRFVPPMSQAERIRHIRMANVCLDQFRIGAYGLGALETMACGRPLITYIRPDYIQRCGLEYPPILNAQSSDEICKAMIRATDPTVCCEIGKKSRTWVLKYHDRSVVCRQLETLYRSLVHKNNNSRIRDGWTNKKRKNRGVES